MVWEKQQATTTDAPAVKGARKDTGDTKTECYYLFSFWDHQCPHQPLHRGAQIQRCAGTGDTKTKCYYLFSTHFGITSAHTNPSPRSPNTALRNARKGTGDTKTECHYPFSTHFGITSAHNNPSQRSPNTALEGARKGTGDTKTECHYLFSTHFRITSAHTNPSPRSPNTAWGKTLVIPKQSATTCSAFILGSPMPTPTLHPGAQIQR